jgi:hypothetical protein
MLNTRFRFFHPWEALKAAAIWVKEKVTSACRRFASATRISARKAKQVFGAVLSATAKAVIEYQRRVEEIRLACAEAAKAKCDAFLDWVIEASAAILSAIIQSIIGNSVTSTLLAPFAAVHSYVRHRSFFLVHGMGRPPRLARAA